MRRGGLWSWLVGNGAWRRVLGRTTGSGCVERSWKLLSERSCGFFEGVAQIERKQHCLKHARQRIFTRQLGQPAVLLRLATYNEIPEGDLRGGGQRAKPMDHFSLGGLYVVTDNPATGQHELHVDAQRRDLRKILGVWQARAQFVPALRGQSDAP